MQPQRPPLLSTLTRCRPGQQHSKVESLVGFFLELAFFAMFFPTFYKQESACSRVNGLTMVREEEEEQGTALVLHGLGGATGASALCTLFK